MTLTTMSGLLLSINDVYAEDASQEKDISGWIFYMDNDLFITPNIDRDYTAGMSVVFTGAGSASHLLSIDAVLGAIDSWPGLKDSGDFVLHSFEFGISGFTPEKTETRFVVQNDRPYASLVYLANNRQYVNLQNKSSLISTLSIGVLGLNTAGNLQNAVHEVVNLEDALGWDNQISKEGELTFRYGLSSQTVRWHDYSTVDKYEIKTALRGSIGYITDVTWSISGRWGDIRSPWWAFNPQTSEYTEKSAPAFPTSKSERGGEFYYWTGLSVHLRAYNVFLQGQTKDSVVTYDSDELNHLILEVWFGVTAEIFDGMRVSYMVRGQTTEIKHGEGSRNPFWGGLMVSQAF
ncbi:MAG: lipid A deacylase LpxR family protein [Gammaproteobacteria bacterium]|nr:lipid A deacylase LpxR family protein [Gammaproteobacteria bacterium]